MKQVLFWLRDALIPHKQTKREFVRDMGITVGLLGAAAVFCVALNIIGDGDSAVPLVFVLPVLL